MKVMGYDIVVEIDGVENEICLDTLYPAVHDWKSATDFAMMMAHEVNPDAVSIDFVECGEFEMEEYKSIPFIHQAPFSVQ